MRLLLDTHTLLWMVGGDPRLGQRAKDAIVTADEVFWSVASLWEIGIKLSLGRPGFEVGPGWSRLIPEEMESSGIRRLGIEPHHCDTVSRLPWYHRDPFDRLMIAQAKTEGLTLVTRDGSIPAYGINCLW